MGPQASVDRVRSWFGVVLVENLRKFGRAGTGKKPSEIFSAGPSGSFVNRGPVESFFLTGGRRRRRRRRRRR